MFKKYASLILFFLIAGTQIFAQTQPVAQATALSFLGVKAYGLSLTFTLSDADSYLILRSGSAVTGVPVDGTEYVVGDRIGNAKVMAIGTNSFYTFRESIANTDYHFAIYAFNSGASPDYLTSSPLTGMATTPGRNTDNYYSNYRIDTDNSIEDLTSLLKNHQDLDYGDYRDLVENVLQKDTSIMVAGNAVNRKYIFGEYSNILHIYEDDIDFSDYNREHVMARSWMPSIPSSDNDLQNETTDQHNLFLVKASVNQSLRSNKIFDVVDNSGNTEGESKSGDNANGTSAFEPKADIKGNIARTLFYMSVTYDKSTESWAFNDLESLGSNQNVDTLLQWHRNDPVDNFEITRNEYIYSKQNNRNPFVDFPGWASCIDFKTMTLNGNCPIDTAAEKPNGIISFDKNNEVKVYPNPVQNSAFVKLSEKENIKNIELINLNGSLLAFSFNLNNNIADLNFEMLPKGFYFLKIYSNEGIYVKKINKID